MRDKGRPSLMVFGLASRMSSSRNRLTCLTLRQPRTGLFWSDRVLPGRSWGWKISCSWKRKIAAGSMHEDIGIQNKQLFIGRCFNVHGWFPVSSVNACRTSSIWVLTLTLRHSRTSMPSGSIKKSAAFYTHDLFAVHILRFYNVKQPAQLLIRVSKQIKRECCLHLKPSWTRTLSRDTPKITAFSRVNVSRLSRKSRLPAYSLGYCLWGKNKVRSVVAA